MKFELPLALLFCSIGSFDAFAPKAFAPKAFSSKHSSSRLFASADNENVVIIGGGVIGLSIAHYLATNSTKTITLLDRVELPKGGDETEKSSLAAAGALGQQFFGDGGTPYAPLFDKSPQVDPEFQPQLKLLLSMCIESGEMYRGWLDRVCKDIPTNPFKIGYRSNRTSVLPRKVIEKWYEPDTLPDPIELDPTFSKSKEDALNTQGKLTKKVSEWSFVDGTATVDAKKLLASLREACGEAGVIMKLSADATSLKTDDGGKCVGVKFVEDNVEDEISGTVVVASGPVLNQLMKDKFQTIPLELKGSKGCTVEVETASGQGAFMKEAAFSEEVGVLPQFDGRVRISNCLGHAEDNIKYDASKIIPALDKSTIKKRITANRPITADNLPILGTDKDWGDLYVAGGFNTYGLWLAPKASKLIGDLILSGGDIEQIGDEDDKQFLEFCNPKRSVDEDDQSGPITANKRRILCF